MEWSICSISTRSEPTAAGRIELRMASGPNTCSICTPARLLVDPAAPSPAALHSHEDAHAQAQRGRAAPWGPERRRETRIWSGKNRFSLAPQLYQNTVEKLRHSRLVLGWEISEKELMPDALGCRVLLSAGASFLLWCCPLEAGGGIPKGSCCEKWWSPFPLVGVTFKLLLNTVLHPECGVFNRPDTSPPEGSNQCCTVLRGQQTLLSFYGVAIITVLLSNLRVKGKTYYFKHEILATIIIFSGMPFFPLMWEWNKLLRAMRICMEISHPKIHFPLFSATSNEKSRAREHETGLLFYFLGDSHHCTGPELWVRAAVSYPEVRNLSQEVLCCAGDQSRW